MTKTNMIIGTRQSLLALWQSNYIAACLRKQYPDCTVTLEKFVTHGDKVLDKPLAQIGGKGLFTKELETALLEGKIDLAVHSLKDMPTKLPEGLCLTAITARENAGDAFVSSHYDSLAAMPQGAVLGTSSLRRRAQILAVRPDLTVIDLRGNVDTRLRKLDEGQMDAVILAAAGLIRLGHQDRIKEILPPEVCLPAVGQGALALETRSDDNETRQRLTFLDCAATHQATDAERSFLALVEGGCQVPIGVHATVQDETVHIEAIIASLDGSRVLRDSIDGTTAASSELGRALGTRMLEQGGRAILQEIL